MITTAHITQRDIIPYFNEKIIQWPDDVVRLHIGEHPFGVSPHVTQQLQKDLHHLHHYPNPTYHVLRQKIAEVYGVDADHIICGNGSEELLHLIPKALVPPGAEVIMPQYTFKGISLGVMACGAVPVVIPQDTKKGCVYTADDVLSLTTPQTRMIMLDHPGNPASTFLPADEVRHVLRVAHERGIFVMLDGAYSEYATHSPGYVLDDTWVKEFPNTMIVRTFSKAYALAALRLGWMHAAPEVVEAIYRIRLPYHINTLAQKAGVYALEDQAYMKECARRVVAIREKCMHDLADFSPWASATNFIVIQTPKEAVCHAEGLQQKGLLTRPLDNYDLPYHLKIAMGEESVMERLCAEWADGGLSCQHLP